MSDDREQEQAVPRVDTQWRFGRKRFNEHVKLLANALNTLGIATMGAALILPAVNTGVASISITNVIWLLAGVTLHFAAQATLRLLRSEE